jgi:hypothetical protein
MGEEKVKLSANGRILHRENGKESTRKLLNSVSESSKGAGLKLT